MAAERGAQVVAVDGVDAALAILRREPNFGLAFCELQHRPATLIAMLARERINLPVVACGLEADADEAVEAIRAGAIEFLPLPPDPELIAAILEATASERHALIARDPAMLAVIRKAELVAGSDASIMIGGESRHRQGGARPLHPPEVAPRRQARSWRSTVRPSPMNSSNPSSSATRRAPSAVRSRDASASSRRPPAARCCSTRSARWTPACRPNCSARCRSARSTAWAAPAPSGSTCACWPPSNRDLQAEIRAGRFRADLFFRLNVVGVTLPALRSRPADIAALARHYAAHYAQLNDVARRPLSAAALAMLEAHSWPGNVREPRERHASRGPAGAGRRDRPRRDRARRCGRRARRSRDVPPPGPARR